MQCEAGSNLELLPHLSLQEEKSGKVTKVVSSEHKSRLCCSFGYMLHRTQQEQVEKGYVGVWYATKMTKGLERKKEKVNFCIVERYSKTKDHKNSVRK